MALDIDGLAVLRAITTAPDAFPELRKELTKVAGTLVVKQLKAKSLGIEGLRKVRAALGPETFALIVEGLKDSEAKSLVTRLDKHHAGIKTAKPVEQRRHLNALGGGMAPAEKPKPPARAPRAAAPRASASPRSGPRIAARAADASRPLESAAMSAVSPRRRKREES